MKTTKSGDPPRVKIVGENFLNNHPSLEYRLDVDSEYVLVQRIDWVKIIKFFEENPNMVQYIK